MRRHTAGEFPLEYRGARVFGVESRGRGLVEQFDRAIDEDRYLPAGRASCSGRARRGSRELVFDQHDEPSTIERARSWVLDTTNPNVYIRMGDPNGAPRRLVRPARPHAAGDSATGGAD